MHQGNSFWLKILVAHLVLDKCLCAPQDLVEPSPEPVPASTHATDNNAEQFNIIDSSSGLNDISANSNSTTQEPPEPSTTQSGPLVVGISGPQERPSPIQTQRNATDGSSSISISSSNNRHFTPHPLQLLIDALMQSQSSGQLMGGLLPRIPLNTIGEDNAKNSLLHRIGVHVLGRTEQLMSQTVDTPLPFVLVALTTTPPSVASLANASIMFSKGIQAITPFTLPPLQKSIPNSSLAVDSIESVEIVTSTESLEKQRVASTESTESLEHSTTTKPASIATVSVSRAKPSPKKHQGKKSIDKSSKQRNPTANDAVERRMAMIAKIEKNMDIATTTASSMPTIPSSNTPASPTTTPITVIPAVPNETIDSSSKLKSNIIVSKADIIDAIVATSAKQTGTLESHANSNTTLTPQSTTTPTSTTLDAATSSLDIVSTTPLSTITPSTTPIIENTSASSPVTITSVKKSSTAIPVRSDLVLDVSQLFRRIVHAAVKETTAAAAAARGENIGNIVSIRPIG